MSDFTFLTKEQVRGENKLKILERRGMKAALTDYAILLGAYVSDHHIDNDNSLNGRTGIYWIKSDLGGKSVYVITVDGDVEYDIVKRISVGARPTLMFSEGDSIPMNGESRKRVRYGVLEVEYGYYPQKAVSRDMQEKLERAYESGTISSTGNSYTTRRSFRS